MSLYRDAIVSRCHCIEMSACQLKVLIGLELGIIHLSSVKLFYIQNVAYDARPYDSIVQCVEDRRILFLSPLQNPSREVVELFCQGDVDM